MRLFSRLVATTGLIALIAVAADAQPRWKLTVKPGEPGVVTTFDPLNKATSYWYFPFSVTNKTGAEQFVFLGLKAMTDTKKTYIAGVYPDAEKRVERIVGRKLRSGRELLGKIANGETWHGVAIFRNVDTSMDKITFRMRGVEDTVVRVRGVSYFEVRALDFTYHQGGDEYYPWEDPIQYLGRRWTVLKQRSRVPRRPVGGR